MKKWSRTLSYYKTFVSQDQVWKPSETENRLFLCWKDLNSAGFTLVKTGKARKKFCIHLVLVNRLYSGQRDPVKLSNVVKF